MQESEFDGSVLDYFKTIIVAALMATLSLGIALPWAIIYFKKWETSHTIINGKRLVFEGTGSDLFNQYIKWYLLTIITLGIYSFWTQVNIRKWVVKHTHFAE